MRRAPGHRDSRVSSPDTRPSREADESARTPTFATASRAVGLDARRRTTTIGLDHAGLLSRAASGSAWLRPCVTGCSRHVRGTPIGPNKPFRRASPAARVHLRFWCRTQRACARRRSAASIEGCSRERAGFSLTARLPTASRIPATATGDIHEDQGASHRNGGCRPCRVVGCGCSASRKRQAARDG